LQQKIDELERSLEGERVKKRVAERELGEVSITLNQKKLLGTQESANVQYLREEIAKKNA
jgi:hypothetical protein